MERLETSQQSKPRTSRTEIFQSLSVLALGLGVNFLGARMIYGEEECYTKYDGLEFTFNLPGCIQNGIGIDPMDLVTND